MYSRQITVDELPEYGPEQPVQVTQGTFGRFKVRRRLPSAPAYLPATVLVKENYSRGKPQPALDAHERKALQRAAPCPVPRVLQTTRHVVMEYLDPSRGQSLSQYMKGLKGRQGTETAKMEHDLLVIIREAFHVLNCLHRQNIAHRDIKPDNIMVQRGPDGRVQGVTFIDLGLACLQDTPGMCEPGDGTPGYMYPYSLSSQFGTSLDTWKVADVYSLTMTLGNVVYAGLFEHEDIIAEHYNTLVPDQFVRNIPHIVSFATLMLKMLITAINVTIVEGEEVTPFEKTLKAFRTCLTFFEKQIENRVVSPVIASGELSPLYGTPERAPAPVVMPPPRPLERYAVPQLPAYPAPKKRQAETAAYIPQLDAKVQPRLPGADVAAAPRPPMALPVQQLIPGAAAPLIRVKKNKPNP